jgi:hypothetical protein
MKCVAIILTTLLLFSGLAGAAPLPAYIDAETNMVLGVNVRAAAGSPMIMRAIEEAGTKAAGSPWAVALLQQTISMVDEVYITGHIDSAAAAGSSDDGYVWLRDNVSSEQLHSAFCASGCEARSHSGIDYFELPASLSEDGKNPHLLTIDSNLVAIAGEARIQAFAERVSDGRTAVISANLQQWVSSLSGHHIWLAALGPFDVPGVESGGPAFGGEAISKLTGFGFGVTIDDPLRMTMEVRSSSEADAQELFNLANGLLAMAKMSQANQADAGQPDILKDLSMSLDGASVRASLSVPQAVLEQFSTGQSQAAAPATEPAQATRPSEPKPRSGEKIQIHGMPGGVREFPVDQ